jgi:hypothetical protein
MQGVPDEFAVDPAEMKTATDAAPTGRENVDPGASAYTSMAARATPGSKTKPTNPAITNRRALALDLRRRAFVLPRPAGYVLTMEVLQPSATPSCSRRYQDANTSRMPEE